MDPPLRQLKDATRCTTSAMRRSGPEKERAAARPIEVSPKPGPLSKTQEVASSSLAKQEPLPRTSCLVGNE